MFMTREQKDKVGPYSYNWAHSPAAAWQSIADGVADFLVLEHAPHTREDVEPGWQDTFSVPLRMTGAQEFVHLPLYAAKEGRLTLPQVADPAAERPARPSGMFTRKGDVQLGADPNLP